ncbi:cyclic nucleotide-binding domain-containing protein [Rugosibacter aromaticivorans]|uniref:cyclic nucleotide-binding domain-containing protein n=1 Tax=Rugosibacter aromaticivorans TaxID=1565605 RepID=UPI001206E4D9|nr:cyclic nucleotide-binding domain-containing protein [Rugosibacter aromaticivorans]TBR15345.1 MAG: cyclic nucleotide-binding domain-containing protein [Rugosibacter sp.]
MSTIDSISNLDYLGDATPFIGRIHEIIASIQMFDDFNGAEIAEFARYLHCYHAPQGSEIIREGEAGDFMLLILEGNVEIVKKDVRGQPQVISIADPGKTLGEMSLIDGEPRFASCMSLTPLDFAVLDRQSLSRLIAEEPGLGIKLLMELLILLNQRLRGVSGQLMDCLEARRARIR